MLALFYNLEHKMLWHSNWCFYWSATYENSDTTIYNFLEFIISTTGNIWQKNKLAKHTHLPMPSAKPKPLCMDQDFLSIYWQKICVKVRKISIPSYLLLFYSLIHSIHSYKKCQFKTCGNSAHQKVLSSFSSSGLNLFL